MVVVRMFFGMLWTAIKDVALWILSKVQATDNSTAQFAHAGVGAALVFILALLFVPTWSAALIVLAFAFLKEYIEYRWGVWEPKDSWRGSTTDFIFWSVGVAIAVVVMGVR